MEEKLSEKLLSHYNNVRPMIIETMEKVVEKNREKILEKWNKTNHPVPIKNAKKITLGGMNYYYIMSIYEKEKDKLEWDYLIYTFIDSEPEENEESNPVLWKKDLVFFPIPGFKIPFIDKEGIIVYTGRFLEHYGYIYGQKEWFDLYGMSERWLRRNPRPLFIITADPLDETNPRGCNVMGKDYDGDGICIGRIETKDTGLIKFVAYYPEDVLEDMSKGGDNIEELLNTFREYVQGASYKNKQDRPRWPDMFMLNKYYN